MPKKEYNILEKRMVTAQEGAGYCGMGTTFFRKWAAQIGARRKIGSLVRYYREILDMALDATEEKEAE